MDQILTVLGILVTVAGILLLAYFSTRFLARWKMGKVAPSSGGGHMRAMDQLSLGTEGRLVLVRVGTRYLLLASSPSGLRLLTELTPEEAVLWEADAAAAASSRENPPGFRESFLAVLKQKQK